MDDAGRRVDSLERVDGEKRAVVAGADTTARDGSVRLKGRLADAMGWIAFPGRANPVRTSSHGGGCQSVEFPPGKNAKGIQTKLEPQNDATAVSEVDLDRAWTRYTTAEVRRSIQVDDLRFGLGGGARGRGREDRETDWDRPDPVCAG
jgi:hypothetical protein